MMGVQPPRQEKLFYTAVSLEQRVRPNHPLRQIAQTIDWDVLYPEVAHCYGTNGNVSVPPPVIVKLMLLLVLYNVRSERELAATLPEGQRNGDGLCARLSLGKEEASQSRKPCSGTPQVGHLPGNA